MCNNRLIIRNKNTGEAFSIAKSFGAGWELRKTADELEEHLQELFDIASFGNCKDPTELELIVENDDRYMYDGDLIIPRTPPTP